jgi:hypothetical protein
VELRGDECVYLEKMMAYQISKNHVFAGDDVDLMRIGCQRVGDNEAAGGLR